MSAALSRWRQIALKIVGHAAWVLPGAESGWADAMQRELDYIDDDRAALRWAIGCVRAGYSARLATLPRLRWRVSSGILTSARRLSTNETVVRETPARAATSALVGRFGIVACWPPRMGIDVGALVRDSNARQ